MSRLLEHVLFVVFAVLTAILTLAAIPGTTNSCAIISVGLLRFICVDGIRGIVDELRLQRHTISRKQRAYRMVNAQKEVYGDKPKQ